MVRGRTGKNDLADAKANAEHNISRGKVKKLKKKKRHNSKSDGSVSSDTASEAGAGPLVIPGRKEVQDLATEQFFDAHECYHGVPANALLLLPEQPSLEPIENQLAAAAPVSPNSSPVTDLLVPRSDHGPDPKISVTRSADHTETRIEN